MSVGRPKVLNSFDALKQLEEYCREAQDAVFIFRGTNKKYSSKNDGVNSKLYRRGKNTAKSKQIKPLYQIYNMEKEIVNKAKRFFPDLTSNRTILTNLQHLGGRTNLIDFSRNLYVALFFACYGNFKKMAN